MPRSKWAKEISVFTSEFDAEHRELMRAADELCHAISGPGLGHAPEKARALLDAIEEHFVHEERLMKSIGYSARQWHQSQHDTLRKRASGLQDSAAAGDRKAVTKFVKYLADWIHAHVSVADRMLAANLRNHQRANSA